MKNGLSITHYGNFLVYFLRHREREKFPEKIVKSLPSSDEERISAKFPCKTFTLSKFFRLSQIFFFFLFQHAPTGIDSRLLWLSQPNPEKSAAIEIHCGCVLSLAHFRSAATLSSSSTSFLRRTGREIIELWVKFIKFIDIASHKFSHILVHSASLTLFPPSSLSSGVCLESIVFSLSSAVVPLPRCKKREKESRRKISSFRSKLLLLWQSLFYFCLCAVQ